MRSVRMSLFSVCAALSTPRRRILIPPVSPLTSGGGSSPHCTARVAGGNGFALRETERGLYDRGLTPDARAFVAEAEEQYRASAAHLNASPGGLDAHTLRHTESDGAVVTTITAPFGETFVPSHAERHAHRGHVGELSRQHAMEPHFLLDEHATLCLRAGRQLRELLDAPMPLQEKADAIARRLGDFYTQRLSLTPPLVETVLALWAQCSLMEREAATQEGGQCLVTSGKTSGAVPRLAEMRRLYVHARVMHVSPTPLGFEAIMTTLCASPEPNVADFHLANRLMLDADRFVVLPTRTTYAAFFRLCSTHNAMSFAVARFKDAVANLHISVDAPMATALLKGLCQSGMTEEALALLARLEHVPMDVQLLNASLEVLLLSPQPQSCFAVFEAVVRDGTLCPAAETYTLLLLVCERTGLWGRVTAILADMQARRVKGDGRTLNLLLKGLLKERLGSYAQQLHATMVAKQVEVWPALAAQMGRETGTQPHTPFYTTRSTRTQVKE